MHKQTLSFLEPTNDMAGHLPAAELKTCTQEAEIATPRHGTASDALIAYLRWLLLPHPLVSTGSSAACHTSPTASHQRSVSGPSAVLRVQAINRSGNSASRACSTADTSGPAADGPAAGGASLPLPAPSPNIARVQLLVNTLLPHPAPSHAARNTEVLGIRCSLHAAPPLNTTCVCGYQRELEQM